MRSVWILWPRDVGFTISLVGLSYRVNDDLAVSDVLSFFFAYYMDCILPVPDFKQLLFDASVLCIDCMTGFYAVPAICVDNNLLVSKLHFILLFRFVEQGLPEVSEVSPIQQSTMSFKMHSGVWRIYDNSLSQNSLFKKEKRWVLWFSWYHMARTIYMAVLSVLRLFPINTKCGALPRWSFFQNCSWLEDLKTCCEIKWIVGTEH